MDQDELARYQDGSARMSDDELLTKIKDVCLNLSFEGWPDEKEGPCRPNSFAVWRRGTRISDAIGTARSA